MRPFRLPVLLAVVVALGAGAALAQPKPAAPPPDPVVARANGDEVHLSELNAVAQTLPAEYRNLPQQTLYPMLLDQAIDRKLIAALARKQGVDKDPAVQAQLQMAQEMALQNALLSKQVGPQITTKGLPAGEAGQSYSQAIGVNGKTPITFKVTSGQLPSIFAGRKSTRSTKSARRSVSEGLHVTSTSRRPAAARHAASEGSEQSERPLG